MRDQNKQKRIPEKQNREERKRRTHHWRPPPPEKTKKKTYYRNKALYTGSRWKSDRKRVGAAVGVPPSARAGDQKGDIFFQKIQRLHRREIREANFFPKIEIEIEYQFLPMSIFAEAEFWQGV